MRTRTTRERIARLGARSAPSFSGEIRQLAAHSVAAGSVDALVVLLLRAVRRLWAPVLVLGVVWIMLEGSVDDADQLRLDTPGQVVSALLSPFAGIVLAVGIRIVTLVLGTITALPRAVAEQRLTDPRAWSVLRSPGDVAGLTSAYRLLRFTSAARDVAASRLGGVGRVFLVIDRVETWLTPAALVALLTTLLVGG